MGDKCAIAFAVIASAVATVAVGVVISDTKLQNKLRDENIFLHNRIEELAVRQHQGCICPHGQGVEK